MERIIENTNNYTILGIKYFINKPIYSVNVLCLCESLIYIYVDWITTYIAVFRYNTHIVLTIIIYMFIIQLYIVIEVSLY